MPTFFLLAGFFTAKLVQRDGVRAALMNRVRRILLPWVASLVLILPVTALFTVDFMIAAQTGSA